MKGGREGASQHRGEGEKKETKHSSTKHGGKRPPDGLNPKETAGFAPLADEDSSDFFSPVPAVHPGRRKKESQQSHSMDGKEREKNKKRKRTS